MYYRCEDQGYRWLKTKWQPWFVQLILLSTKGWVLSCFENSTYSDFKLFMVWMPQISWIFSFIQVLSNFHKNDNWYYYISQLLCALWLDNLAGRTPILPAILKSYGPWTRLVPVRGIYEFKISVMAYDGVARVNYHV